MTESLVCFHMPTIYVNVVSLSVAQGKELVDEKMSQNKKNKF